MTGPCRCDCPFFVPFFSSLDRGLFAALSRSRSCSNLVSERSGVRSARRGRIDGDWSAGESAGGRADCGGFSWLSERRRRAEGKKWRKFLSSTSTTLALRFFGPPTPLGLPLLREFLLSFASPNPQIKRRRPVCFQMRKLERKEGLVLSFQQQQERKDFFTPSSPPLQALPPQPRRSATSPRPPSARAKQTRLSLPTEEPGG